MYSFLLCWKIVFHLCFEFHPLLHQGPLLLILPLLSTGSFLSENTCKQKQRKTPSITNPCSFCILSILFITRFLERVAVLAISLLHLLISPFLTEIVRFKINHLLDAKCNNIWVLNLIGCIKYCWLMFF